MQQHNNINLYEAARIVRVVGEREREVKKQFNVRAKQTEIMRFCGSRNPLVVRNSSGRDVHPRVVVGVK